MIRTSIDKDFDGRLTSDGLGVMDKGLRQPDATRRQQTEPECVATVQKLALGSGQLAP